MRRAQVRRERIEAVASVLSMVPPEALDAAEANDPQFEAVLRIASKHGYKSVAIVVANALVSYRLAKHGEDYWMDYARFWSQRGTPSTADELIAALQEFMRAEHVPLIEQKLQRLYKARDVLDSLLVQPRSYRDLTMLYTRISRLYTRGSSRYQKTAAFAAKMAYYAFKALDERVTNLEAVPVPLDRRLAVLSSTSGIVEADPDTVYTRLRNVAEEAWREVARRSRIPPARLDTLLWLPARSIEPLVAKGLLEIARDEFTHRLIHYTLGRINVKLARRIAEELLRYPPSYSLREARASRSLE